MHIAIVTGIGLVVLAVFFFVASLIGKGGPSGAYVFIWVWLVVSIANGTYGVVRAGQIALFVIASQEDPALRRSITGLAVSTAIGLALLIGGALMPVPVLKLHTSCNVLAS